MARKKKFKQLFHYVLQEPGLMDIEGESRRKRFAKYKERKGFSPDELWDLAHATAWFMLPRLKEFRKVTCGYPCELKSMDEWREIIDKMIFAFEWYLDDDNWYKEGEEHDKAMDGFDLFGKWLLALWY